MQTGTAAGARPPPCQTAVAHTGGGISGQEKGRGLRQNKEEAEGFGWRRSPVRGLTVEGAWRRPRFGNWFELGGDENEVPFLARGFHGMLEMAGVEVHVDGEVSQWLATVAPWGKTEMAAKS